MLKALYQSVFAPTSFIKNPKGLLIVNRYGWIFIVIRWLTYSIVFSFRDYHGNWKPFIPPPFGIDANTYAFLQTYFSLLFGIFVMGSIALVLFGYLQLIGKGISSFKIFNILGIAFFLPFIIVQSIDVFVMLVVGWVSYLIIPIHVLVLLWESFATTVILSKICRLKLLEKVICIMIIIIVWIGICALLWR